jgi:uncharacterized membrane protein
MNKLRIIAIVAAIIGLTVSAYLSWAKLSNQNVVCFEAMGDCNLVNSSSYSTWRGIPIAFLGMVAYALILILFAFKSTNEKTQGIIALSLFGITVFGSLYSIYLTYLELFVIHALCPWCLVSAIAMIMLCVISMIFLSRSKIIESIH